MSDTHRSSVYLYMLNLQNARSRTAAGKLRNLHFTFDFPPKVSPHSGPYFRPDSFVVPQWWAQFPAHFPAPIFTPFRNTFSHHFAALFLATRLSDAGSRRPASERLSARAHTHTHTTPGAPRPAGVSRAVPQFRPHLVPPLCRGCRKCRRCRRCRKSRGPLVPRVPRVSQLPRMP